MDEKKVPLKFGIGGPVIGTAIAKETPEGLELEITLDTTTPEGRQMMDSYVSVGSFSIGKNNNG